MFIIDIAKHQKCICYVYMHERGYLCTFLHNAKHLSAFLICIRQGTSQVKYSTVSYLVFICEPEYKLYESEDVVGLIHNTPSLCNRCLLDK